MLKAEETISSEITPEETISPEITPEEILIGEESPEEEEEQPGRLMIDGRYRIFLPDYGNAEIKLEPLQKTLFLLYIRHPEGIRFKDLCDYKEELMHIYAEVGRRCEVKPAGNSIERLTSPLDNSINEKSSKIKRSFIKAIGPERAKWYYIDGRKGEARRIALPRELVVTSFARRD